MLFFWLRFFVTFNIILSSNFPEKMNENEFRLHIFSKFPSTEIGFFSIYFSIRGQYLKNGLDDGCHWNQGIQKKLIVIVFLLHLGPYKHVSISFMSKKNFRTFLVSHAKQEVKMPQNHHFCWRQHQKQPTWTFPEIFSCKNQKFRWLNISIPIFIAIACIIRKKRGGGKFAPPPLPPGERT